MRVSVILSTYNQPAWLEKVLWGYATQSQREFEIVIADDGSRVETRRRIDDLRRVTGLSIRHLWHEDRGFRKCTILNRAVEGAKGDYLIFSDGDCIPRHDFVETHLKHAQKGRFLSGGTIRLPLHLSHVIHPEDVQTGRYIKPAWLNARGLGWNKQMLMVWCGARLGAWLDRLTTTRATFNGCNTSAWKADVVQVNGFDERMEWGGEDRECGERLVNLGIKGVQLRYRAVCLHLDHSRGYVRDEAVQRNKELRRETVREKKVWTDFGIQQASLPAKNGKKIAA
jgi:glycosyltransferase involved in cell wall biosynthesis